MENLYPSSIGIGFDFYGAGNIGDDLMIAGFIKAISQIYSQDSSCKLYSLTRWNINSQRVRFPEIAWISTTDSISEKYLDSSQIQCWAGIGDTPFQLTSGEWFLEFQLSQLNNINSFQNKVLVSVGAESEIEPRSRDFAKIADVFDRISTRDIHSYKIITQLLGIAEDRIYCGADLANISLFNLVYQKKFEKKFNLGLIVAGDTLSKKDIRSVGNFIQNSSEPIAFIAGETRLLNYVERGIYARLTRFPLSKVKKMSTLCVPHYDKGSIEDLVAPICACETIISSRYHGLLTAAWAGCKVAAIGRSSKVSALAELLKIPYAELPITPEKLKTLSEQAVIVSTDILLSLKEKALQSVAFALNIED